MSVIPVPSDSDDTFHETWFWHFAIKAQVRKSVSAMVWRNMHTCPFCPTTHPTIDPRTSFYIRSFCIPLKTQDWQHSWSHDAPHHQWHLHHVHALPREKHWPGCGYQCTLWCHLSHFEWQCSWLCKTISCVNWLHKLNKNYTCIFCNHRTHHTVSYKCSRE